MTWQIYGGFSKEEPYGRLICTVETRDEMESLRREFWLKQEADYWPPASRYSRDFLEHMERLRNRQVPGVVITSSDDPPLGYSRLGVLEEEGDR